MKKHLFYVAAIAALLLGSCAKESFSSEKSVETEEQLCPHTIPVETALASLDDFLASVDEGRQTKSGMPDGKRKVKDVQTVYTVNGMTKSDGNAEDGNALVYIVNFENDGGYAIISADDRIPEDILAVYDSGNYKSSPNRVIDKSQSSARRIYDDYPKDGPGIIEDEEGNRYLNPNTFSLYDEASGEYLVGDLTAEGGYLPNESGSGSNTKPGKKLDDILPDRVVLDYADGKVSGGSKFDDVKPRIDDPGDDIKDVTINGPYKREYMVSPILSFAQLWRQESPFNDWCPTVRRYILFGQKGKAPSGCVPLALAKIIAYCEYPHTINYNGTVINMSTIKDGKIGNPEFNYQSAAFLRFIGESCNSLYFYDGTFTFPKNAADFLGKIGYSNVNYGRYTTSTVISSLKKSVPVFVCSVPNSEKYNYDLLQSHAWMIDGYMNRTREVTHKRYRNDVLENQWTTTTSNTMVHCDFGWEGKFNGYFTSGIFNFADNANVEFDNNAYIGADKTNYKWYLKTITYDNPKH